jgi:hypothetical protein
MGYREGFQRVEFCSGTYPGSVVPATLVGRTTEQSGAAKSHRVCDARASNHPVHCVWVLFELQPSGISPDDFACTILRTITHTFRRTIDELVTLKQLCAEMKINPREARERLRLAVRDAKHLLDP